MKFNYALLLLSSASLVACSSVVTPITTGSTGSTGSGGSASSSSSSTSATSTTTSTSTGSSSGIALDCVEQDLFLRVTVNGQERSLDAGCTTDKGPSGGLVFKVNEPSVVAVYACDAAGTSYVSMAGEPPSGFPPGDLLSPVIRFMFDNNPPTKLAQPAVNMTQFGAIGQVIEGTFSGQVPVIVGNPLVPMSGSFRVCRGPDREEP